MGNTSVLIVPVSIFGLIFDMVVIGKVTIDEINRTASWEAAINAGEISILRSFYLSDKDFDSYYDDDSTPGIVSLTLSSFGVKGK